MPKEQRRPTGNHQIRPRRKRPPAGNRFSVWIDRNIILIASGIVMIVWLASDALGLVLSEGAKAAMASFVAYAIWQAKRDEKWRSLETASAYLQELQDAVQELDKTHPGSREAIEARKQIIQLTLEQKSESEEDAK